MGMSIGIDYIQNMWKVSQLENGQVVELRSFVHVDEAVGYVTRVCAVYDEPVFALSSSREMALSPLSTLVANEDENDETDELQQFLRGIRYLSTQAYHLPSVRYIKSIPRYRKYMRAVMGKSEMVGTVATLLYRMRQQDANWPELRFLLLRLDATNRHILVVKNGQVVDGIVRDGLYEHRLPGEERLTGEERKQALWEELSQDIAGLMATHHFEDIVLITGQDDGDEQGRRDEVVNRLGDMYQFYHFPHESAEPEGFEAAIGAALIAEGLYRPGLASEVVDHLQLSSTAR